MIILSLAGIFAVIMASGDVKKGGSPGGLLAGSLCVAWVAIALPLANTKNYGSTLELDEVGCGYFETRDCVNHNPLLGLDDLTNLEGAGLISWLVGSLMVAAISAVSLFPKALATDKKCQNLAFAFFSATQHILDMGNVLGLTIGLAGKKWQNRGGLVLVTAEAVALMREGIAACAIRVKENKLRGYRRDSEQPAGLVHSVLDILGEILSAFSFAIVAVQTGDQVAVLMCAGLSTGVAIASGFLFAKKKRDVKTVSGVLPDIATFAGAAPVITGAVLVFIAPEMLVLYAGTAIGAVSEVCATIWELTSF